MIDIMTQNPKKVFYLDQNKTGGGGLKRKEKSFDLELFGNLFGIRSRGVNIK